MAMREEEKRRSTIHTSSPENRANIRFWKKVFCSRKYDLGTLDF